MNRCFRLMVCCCLLASALTCRSQGIDKQQLAQIDRIVAELMNTSRAPGLAVAVGVDNQLKYAKGYGLADVENEVAVTNETLFRTASIAKSMTAVVVLSLVEEGKLDLDEPVQTYCPDFPEKRWPVTSRQLLAHLGGVRHYKNDSESSSKDHFDSLSEALAVFANDPLIHEPGTKYKYSSFGFNLLGSVAEGAGDRAFVSLLRDHVFQPSGMTQTVPDDHYKIIPGRTRGYRRQTRRLDDRGSDGNRSKQVFLQNASLHDTSMKIPGGGLLSTPSDLVRFALAVNTGKLLRPDTRDEMWTRQRTRHGEWIEYGLGWRVGWCDGRRAVSHSGGQAGTSTIMLLIPDDGISVAMMCNLQGVGLREKAKEIAEVLLPPAEPTDYTEAIAKLRQAVTHEVQAKRLPAFSISLVDHDQPIWADGFGFQDAERKKPATADTVYRVGSISKLFTDIAVMQLVEDGRLDLDVPVGEYLAEFKPENPYDEEITLRRLMSHQSGLVRESPVGNYFDPSEPSLAATVASLNDTALVYRPQTKTKYSNAAIAVVGAVLEQVLEESHPERVQQTLLRPLAMDRSSFVVTPDIEPSLATGWMRTYDGRRSKAPTFLLGTGPAGNLYSSVTDLSQFLICLFDHAKTDSGQIMEPATFAEMTQPVKDSDGNTQGFGLGFSIKELDGYKRIGHGGAVYGFSTQLEALPERELGVVAASSLDGSNGVTRRLAEYALRLMVAAKDDQSLPDYETTGIVPPSRVAQLAGMYHEIEGERFARISYLGDDTFLQRGSLRYDLGVANDGTIMTDDVAGFGMRVEPIGQDRVKVGGATYARVSDQPPRTFLIAGGD